MNQIKGARGVGQLGMRSFLRPPSKEEQQRGLYKQEQCAACQGDPDQDPDPKGIPSGMQPA
eukprot:507709-Pelagomonas_calceolata.AAC.3